MDNVDKSHITKLKLRDFIPLPNGGHMRALYDPAEKMLFFLSVSRGLKGFSGPGLDLPYPISDVGFCKITHYKNLLVWMLLAKNKHKQDTVLAGKLNLITKEGRRGIYSLEEQSKQRFLEAKLLVNEKEELWCHALIKDKEHGTSFIKKIGMNINFKDE